MRMNLGAARPNIKKAIDNMATAIKEYNQIKLYF